jgi:lipopolysaccharide export system protein LptA
MRRRLVLAALLIGLAAPALAEADPVKITADQFVVDDASRVATFTGKVVVTRQSLTVWAQKVVVDYGAGGPSNINSFVASGGVRIKTADQDATGDRAVYDPRAATLKLTGNVKVVNASGTVAAPDLMIDLRTNSTVFSGGSGGRVTGVFTPQ